jgi:monovalent cation:H+ antiporter-2, CPA2 family
LENAAHFLQDLAVILTVAAITTVACQRLHLPVIVGYIVAGLLTGAANPFRLVGDVQGIRTLSELGVILLMYSIGLEFSLRRLVRLIPIVGVAAAVEMGLMLGLGYLGAQLAGWNARESLFAGAIVAISSTMIVAKAFEDRKPTRRLEDLVLGVLVMEDLVAIVLLVFLTAEATGRGVAAASLVRTVGQLLGFLAIILVAGMLIVPRAMRAVVALRRNETTLVAAVGIAFLVALLAELAGYSVALGAFIAGTLVRESGAGYRILELLRPVRDLFAAIFFVAVGMLVQPGEALVAWPAILALTVIVLVGKMIGVSVGGFLAGFGVQTSVRAGMTLAQIGEFSFVIAGLGLASGAAPPALYPVAVSVSIITAALTPLLMRLADPISATIDRKLPKPVQTFVTLYESWVELLRRGTKRDTTWRQIRPSVRWMFADAILIGAIIVGLSVVRERAAQALLGSGVPERILVPALFAIGAALVMPFAIGLVTSARRVATRLAEAAMPPVKGVDQARAPRGLLVVVIQIASVIVLGLPLLALTQPFLSAAPAAVVIAAILLLLAISFWRAATNLQGHATAGAELVVDVISRQGADKDHHSLEVVQEMLPGMGTIVPFQVGAGSAAVGRSLGELNLRGLTGVSVVALSRGRERIVFPKGDEVLKEGDVLALTGSHDAIAAAHRLLRSPRQPAPRPG